MFKIDCQKITTYNIRHEKCVIKNKTNKNWEKKVGTMHCLGCKDYTDSFKQQEIKMANKVLREKSNYVVCQSSKSRFLTQKHNNNKNFQRQHKLSNSFLKLQKHAYIL